MVDDYTAKMTELIELMRLIGNDTQQCEVKECKRKISSTITDTLSAFSNGSGGWIILGLSEKNGFTPVEGFDARAATGDAVDVLRETMGAMPAASVGEDDGVSPIDLDLGYVLPGAVTSFAERAQACDPSDPLNMTDTAGSGLSK